MPPDSSANAPQTIIRIINELQCSEEECVAEVITMLIAGHETVGFFLSTILVLLAKNPKIAEKLRLELSSMEEKT